MISLTNCSSLLSAERDHRRSNESLKLDRYWIGALSFEPGFGVKVQQWHCATLDRVSAVILIVLDTMAIPIRIGRWGRSLNPSLQYQDTHFATHTRLYSIYVVFQLSLLLELDQLAYRRLIIILKLYYSVLQIRGAVCCISFKNKKKKGNRKVRRE